MKKIVFAAIILVLGASFTACGNSDKSAKTSSTESAQLPDEAYNSEEETLPPDASDESEPTKFSSSSDIPEPKNEALSGETLQLIGLEWKEAYDLMGKGSDPNLTNDGRCLYISNDKNGISVSLTNTIDNIDLYTVHSVILEKDCDVSFYGIKIGDTLKNADKLLMDNGAKYLGSLKWYIEIDSAPYNIQLNTADDKTIASIEGSIPEYDMSIDLEMQKKLEDSPFSYTEDWHNSEPLYWE